MTDSPFFLPRYLLYALALLTATGASAQPLRCEINGESVNPANGSTTAGKTGLMRCRTDSGALQREEELRNGKFIGMRNFYSAEGRKEGLVNEKGNQDGPAREFYADGKLKEESLYANGERIGLSKRYYPTGQLERIAFAAPNRERGSSLEYLEDGKLRSLQCAPSSRMPEDRAPCGHAGSASQLELFRGTRGAARLATRASYRDGVLIDSTDMDNEGRPARSYSLKDGVETSREYFPDGKPRRERALSRGPDRSSGRDGSEREWASNGQLIAERRFAGGFETVLSEWFMNGSLKQKRTTEGTGRDALARAELYYDTGKLRARTQTRGGRSIGKQELFDEAGILREEAAYDERGTLKTKRTFDAGGKLLADEEFFEDGSRKLK